MGRRIYVQAIMPGLIYQVSNQDKTNIYGSTDDFKTFKVDDDFKDSLKEIFDKMEIKSPTKVELDNKSFEFVGPLELKGTMTEDSKRYIVDLLYMTPKDKNFTS